MQEGLIKYWQQFNGQVPLPKSKRSQARKQQRMAAIKRRKHAQTKKGR